MDNKKTRKVMTRELIFSATTFPKNRDETVEHYLSRITHVHLQSKRLGKIKGLELCDHLQNLYLYDNYIEVIENISNLKSLKSLFLQNNLIKSIPQLSNSTLLKLRLDENEIEVVEGLEMCDYLEELSVASQRITSPIRFDFNSLNAISRSLKYLDISGNNITSFKPKFFSGI